MAVKRDENNPNMWRVIFRYTDWQGNKRQSVNSDLILYKSSV